MNAPSRGMSLVDVIVGSALILIVFLALLGLMRASLLVSSSAKAKAGATTVASSHLEYIRSLPYDAVGTMGGIPSGSIPQMATTTLNGISYGVRTLVQYVDDPKDGTGTGDTNGITTDYKRVRVTTTYLFRNEEREVALISNVSPRSVETTTGGGLLRIAVVSAGGLPVPGASVRIENTNIAPAIDITTFSDVAGAVILPGAPTSTAYQVTVEKGGYSSAYTYERDATNQNPTPGYLTVAKDQTTTGTFAIDALSYLTLNTFSPARTASTTDTFLDTGGIATLSGIEVSGGALRLAGGPGSYVPSGTVTAEPIVPVNLYEWDSVEGVRNVPAGTSFKLSIGDVNGTPLPDSSMPGNSTGFSSFPISLTGVSTTTYPGLTLLATLTSSSVASTPEILEWTLSYTEGPTPLPDVAVTLTGAKKKGTTGSGAPLYKTTVATTTGSLGSVTLPLEWDVYSLSLLDKTIIQASTTPPYSLSPGEAVISDLIVQ